MTENEDEVKPLHRPVVGHGDCYFVCNINGEVSLWYVIGRLRAYTAHGRGTYMEDLLRDPEERLEGLSKRPSMRGHAEILRRNIDVIKLYGAMLQEPRSGVG